MRADATQRNIGFVVFDMAGRILDVNQAACERLEYTLPELKQLPIGTVMPGFNLGEILFLMHQTSDRWIQWSGILQARAGDSTQVQARVIQVLDRSEPAFLAIFSIPSSGATGEPIPTLESVCRWADDLAHRLNNLLTIVQVHASYLIGEEKLGPDAAESVREIYQAVNRAADLTTQLASMNERFAEE